MAVTLNSPRSRPVSINDAANLAGLSVSTLRTYTQAGRSDLIRGLDFYVHRQGVRRRLYFTARGLSRLLSRNYRSESPSQRINPRAYNLEQFGLPPRYEGSSAQERRQRVQQMIYIAFMKYKTHPCAVPWLPLHDA
jgi:hypothetical protein